MSGEHRNIEWRPRTFEEKDRMSGTKILAMFYEFPFLHRYAENSLRLHSVKVYRMNEELLLQRAQGGYIKNLFTVGERTPCQTRIYVFLDQEAREIGRVSPSTWMKIWFRKFLEFFELTPGFSPSATLLEVLRKDQEMMNHAHYILEILGHEHTVKEITVFKSPLEQDLPQMVGKYRAQY